MKKFFLHSFAGSLSTLSGFASGYIYIDGLRVQANHILLGVALLLITIGFFFLRKAIKSGNPFGERIDPMSDGLTDSKAGFESTLQKNNELMADWSKTMKTRDGLKVLQISESAKQQSG